MRYIAIAIAWIGWIATAKCSDPSLISDQMMITRDGKPMAVIVAPDDAGRTEKAAAEELQKYLEKISGARLDIIPEHSIVETKGSGPAGARIFIGRTKAAELLCTMLKRRDTDAFLVKIERQQIGEFVDGAWDDRPGSWHNLFLVGANDRGTLYAVYDFLERNLGCRWLAPGELWEEIPRQATIAVPAGVRLEEPAMQYRADRALGTYDWALKHKFNTRRGLYWPNEYNAPKPLPIDERGWLAVHNAPRIVLGVSREHPEWFALNDNGIRIMYQLCFSNPEVHDILADRLSQALREQPELEFVEMGCADGLPLNYCRCERCLEWDACGSVARSSRGHHTHRWLAMVNAVAERLAESDPGKKLVAAAYSSYQEPPDIEIIQPAGNVIITYWTWAGCRMHGLEHTAVVSNSPPEMGAHAVYRQWLEAWGDLTPAGLIVAEYVSRSSMDGMSGPNPRRYINDLRYLRHNGCVGYLAFDDPLPWGVNMINRYAIAKATWNPELDAAALLRDFCDNAFHAASGDMQRFIATIQAAMQSAGCSHMRITGWMQPEPMAEARRHLNAARAAASGDTTVERRLRPFEFQFRYSELAGPAENLWLGERDVRLIQQAINLGEEALAYRDAMRLQYPDEPFLTGHRMSGYVGKDGSWRKLLSQIENERK